jgi:anti-sigma regulatory factor (Ser/Thr protein kinase)
MPHLSGHHDFQLMLVREPDSATVARRELDRYRDVLEEAELEITALLMTELIANSVQHAGADAGDDLRLDLAVAPERIRVEVRDGGRGFVPAPRVTGIDMGLHWGVELVKRLADRWDVVAGDGICDTLVWFELDRDRVRYQG